ncbi:hypothetical protein [Streptomyces sp. NPDC090022]|uniref:hypothetical protein n=1 Tax=Streptomyces sp. NPDC090022 TaxID=3365920 RepID=UPI0038266F9E
MDKDGLKAPRDKVWPYEDGLPGGINDVGPLDPFRPAGKSGGFMITCMPKIHDGTGVYLTPSNGRASFKAHAVLAEYRYPEEPAVNGRLPARSAWRKAPAVVISPSSGTLERGAKIPLVVSGRFSLGDKKFFLVVENGDRSNSITIPFECFR